jgi:hypothetical protein
MLTKLAPTAAAHLREFVSARGLGSGAKHRTIKGGALHIAVVLLVCSGVLLSSPSAKANSISYYFTGTVSPVASGTSNTVSGTFTLDLTNQEVIDWNFNTPTGAMNFSTSNSTGFLSQFLYPPFPGGPNYLDLLFTSNGYPCGPGAPPPCFLQDQMTLLFQSTLSGFASGGPLFTGVALNGQNLVLSNIVTFQLFPTGGVVGGVGFVSGQATSVPEPASFILFNTGFLGVLGVVRRKFLR